MVRLALGVSILTRPFGRVQPVQLRADFEVGFVSILTRPFGRVQRCASTWASFSTGFNPHPPFRTGATDAPQKAPASGRGFNPHPPFRTGATFSDTSRAGRFEFQSSPALSDGCNFKWLPVFSCRELPKFQSSPALSDGCNVWNGICCLRGRMGFQSSPALSDGCNSISIATNDTQKAVSILTRPFGRVQRTVSNSQQREERFQSSPALSDGCNLCLDWQATMYRVSILTRPFGRVQLQR